MPETGLNLAALRQRSLPGRRPDPERPQPISRRELFGAAGITAAAISPAVRALGDSLQGPFHLEHDAGRAVFLFGDQARWAVDINDYSGKPELSVVKEDKAITLALRGATYPGTDIPADFTCEMKAGLTGWKMKLRHAFGGFKGQAPFERWLLGQAPLESAVKVRAEVCSLGGEAPVILEGEGHAEYLADGGFRLQGVDIARVEGEKPLASSHARLSLLREDDPTVFDNLSGKRTLLTMHREGHAWPLRPVVDSLPAGELHCYADPFETLHVEVAPGGSAPRVAMLAESRPEYSDIVYRPQSRLVGENNAPFELRLRNSRYAVSFDSDGPRSALLADYDKASWMHADGCSVLVGDGANAAPFEITGRSGRTESLTCAPALLGVSAPLSGAVVEPALFTEGETIHFEPEQLSKVQIRPQATVTSQINQAKLNPLFAHIGIMLPTRIRVVRPQDMLALEFQFINMRFQAGGAAPSMVRAAAGKAAYLVVHFPPQHIAEAVGTETTGSGNQPIFTPPNPMPAQTRMSGPSRLAFLIPNSVTSIPYTIEGLLDWSKLVPSVVPAADPPPTPLRLPTGAISLPASGSSFKSGEIDDDNRIRLTRTISTQSRGFDPIAARPNLAALSPQELPDIPQERGLLKQSLLQAQPKLSVTKLPVSIAQLLENKSIREPHPFETAIEFPYRVTLSPHDISGWKHESDVDKVTHGNRTELWHTRLGTLRSGRVDERDDYYRTVRAVWSEDYTTALPTQNQQPRNPFTMALTPFERNCIVWRSAEWSNLKQAGRTVTPLPVKAEQFMLTPLGASVDLRGLWDDAVSVPLTQWINKTQIGRDNFVRTDMIGYLMPFGHRAVLVKITERKIWYSGTERFAVLFQKEYVEVKEPEKTYPLAGIRDSGNRMPFAKVQIKTKRTPNMDPTGGAGQFFPKVAGSEFRFSIAATDETGRESEFSMPLMFVMSNIAHPPQFPADNRTNAIKTYNGSGFSRLRVADMQGQKVGFAPAAIPGDTVLETQSISWLADPLLSVADTRVPFAPAMANAEVCVPAARAIADAAGNISVSYPQVYWENQFAGVNSKNQVFLKLNAASDDQPQLRYDSGGKGEKAGGMGSPNVKISGISRKHGVIGGTIAGITATERVLSGALRGTAPSWDFKPKEYFGEKAKLLGFLALKEIIPDDPIGGDGRNAPKLTFKEEPDKLTTTLEWNPDLNNPVLPSPLDKLFVPYPEMLDGGKFKGVLEIKCQLVTWLPFGTTPPAEPTYDILGKANKFTMDIFESIELKFDYVKFTAKSGAGVDVDPKFGKDWIKFKGPLAFVNELKDMLPGAKKDGDRALTRGESKDLFEYFIDPSPSGIRAGFTINIPSVAVGVFSLQNIGVGAEIDIPFTGDPLTLTFNFCSRDNQFLLTVWIFGGGGFFNLTVGLDGIIGFEAGFQFGVAASISFGIASGGVSVMAGFSYDYERVKIGTTLAGDDEFEGKSTLVGYFEANGWVDVLGLISASLELYLGLEYTSQGGSSELWGTARITFRIEILFLSFEVSAEVEKRFAGSGPSSRALPAAGSRAAVTSALGGVKFEQIYSEPEWNEYCLAFA